MIFQYKNTWKVTEMLNDLVKIHNDRIAGYLHALNQLSKINTGLCGAFEKVILESTTYKDQLLLKIKDLNGNSLKGVTILGKIYRAWMALKVTFPASTQKAILTTCMFNEEIALHAYKVALNSNLHLDKETFKLIESQENGLNEMYATINKYRENGNTYHESRNKVMLSLPNFV